MRVILLLQSDIAFNRLRKDLSQHQIPPFAGDLAAIRNTLGSFDLDAAVLDIHAPWAADLHVILSRLGLTIIKFDGDFNQVLSQISHVARDFDSDDDYEDYSEQEGIGEADNNNDDHLNIPSLSLQHRELVDPGVQDDPDDLRIEIDIKPKQEDTSEISPASDVLNTTQEEKQDEKQEDNVQSQASENKKKLTVKDKISRTIKEAEQATQSIFKFEDGEEDFYSGFMPDSSLKERIIGTVVIAVAGVDRRTGCTHSALQISRFLSRDYAVACVELIDPQVTPSAFQSFQTKESSQRCKGGFVFEDVDYFPMADMFQLMAILSSGYKYIVLDMGQIVHGTGGKNKKSKSENQGKYALEFMRADFQLLTTGSSRWDFGRLVRTLDVFYSWGWQKELRILALFTDDQLFKEVTNSFTKKEKKHLHIDFYQQVFSPDVFHLSHLDQDHYERVLRSVLPRGTNKKRGWFRRGGN